MNLKSREYMDKYEYYKVFATGMTDKKEAAAREQTPDKELDISPKDMVMRAEAAYYRGDMITVKQLSEKSMKCAVADNEYSTVITAASLLGRCAASVGDITAWKEAFVIIDNACKREPKIARSAEWMRSVLYTGMEMLDMINEDICDEANDDEMTWESLRLVQFIRVGFYVGKGDLAKVCSICIAEREECRGLGAPAFIYNSMALTSAYAFSGKEEDIPQILREALDETKKTGFIMPISEMSSPVITYLTNKNFPEYADLLNELRALNRKYLSGLLNLYAQIYENDLLAELTPKEFAVVRYVAEGAHNSEIAEKMSISENTVKSYLKIAFEKLGVKKRKQIAAVISDLKHSEKNRIK